MMYFISSSFVWILVLLFCPPSTNSMIIVQSVSSYNNIKLKGFVINPLLKITVPVVMVWIILTLCFWSHLLLCMQCLFLLNTLSPTPRSCILLCTSACAESMEIISTPSYPMWSHCGIVYLNLLYVLPHSLFLNSLSIISFCNFINYL